MTYSIFHGEPQPKPVDETLREYFKDYNYKGVFVDVGAYEPINISNSYHFEMNDWDTYCIEANSLLIDTLKSKRKNVYNYAISDENKESITFNVVTGPWGGGSRMAGCSAIDLDPRYMETFGKHIQKIQKINVNQRTLNSLLEEINLEKIDILSMDIEGGEIKALNGLNFEKYSPKVVLLENIFNDSSIHNFMDSKGYKLDKKYHYNEYYIVK